MVPVIADKRGLLERPQGAKLDLGCGSRKVSAEYIGIDLLDSPQVDVVADVRDVLRALPPGCLSRVYSSHFLEHIDDVSDILRQLERTIAIGGELEVIVPHFSNPYFYSDPTHTSTFGLYSFGYYLKDTPLRRRVPNYGNELSFCLTGVSLGFKSSPPFYARHAAKRLFGALVNATRWGKEVYEENLCYLFPCYEVRFLLVRV